MTRTMMHPNTRAMLHAWRRMSASPEDLDGGPSVQDYPGILGRLFILHTGPRMNLPFRIVGDQLPGLIGKPLIGTDFLSLWLERDRRLLTAFLDKIVAEDRPGLLRAHGDTRRGTPVEIEMTFAPLGHGGSTPTRLLGLYQTLESEPSERAPSIVTHRLKSLYPPEAPSQSVSLRVVANNTA
ncbi:MAG: PAS domain-containing protein [Pseudomonadota bacterium]